MGTDSKALVAQFEIEFQPHESGALVLLTDNITGAEYCECHAQASTLIARSTIGAPLDPSADPATKQIVSY